MSDENKVPITAKLPESLHNQLLDAIQANRCRDKTDCIIQALNGFLNNSIDTTEADQVIQRLTLEIQEKLIEIEELHEVIQKLPDPLEIAKIEVRNEVIQVILAEKDNRIEELKENLRDLRVIAYKPISQVSDPCNSVVIQSNTVSGGLIKKLCKNCGEVFFTGNNRKEYCSLRCKTAFGRKKEINYDGLH